MKEDSVQNVINILSSINTISDHLIKIRVNEDSIHEYETISFLFKKIKNITDTINSISVIKINNGDYIKFINGLNIIFAKFNPIKISNGKVKRLKVQIEVLGIINDYLSDWESFNIPEIKYDSYIGRYLGALNLLNYISERFDPIKISKSKIKKLDKQLNLLNKLTSYLNDNSDSFNMSVKIPQYETSIYNEFLSLMNNIINHINSIKYSKSIYKKTLGIRNISNMLNDMIIDCQDIQSQISIFTNSENNMINELSSTNTLSKTTVIDNGSMMLNSYDNFIKKLNNIFNKFNPIKVSNSDVRRLNNQLKTLNIISDFVSGWKDINMPNIKYDLYVGFFDKMNALFNKFNPIKISDKKLKSLDRQLNLLNSLTLYINDNSNNLIINDKISQYEMSPYNRFLSLMNNVVDHINSINYGESIYKKLSGIKNIYNTLNDMILNSNNIQNHLNMFINYESNIIDKLSNPEIIRKLKHIDNTGLLKIIKKINKEAKSFTSISDKDAINTEKTLNSYGKFIEKINTVKVENLEKSTAMFQQMAKFSESIEGNFEKLAEVINEKLMPLLQEMKEVSNDTTKKLETGFANTSATMAATAAGPMNQTSMTAQVQRENPNMSKKDIEKMVDNRMKDQAKNQAQSLTAKIDEVIELLQGSGKIKVVPV